MVPILKLLKQIHDLFFSWGAVSFRIQGNRLQVIECLEHSLEGQQGKRLFLEPYIEGTVRQSKVKLTRFRTMMRNSFTPTFYGVLQEDGAETILKGYFAMNLGIRILLTGMVMALVFIMVQESMRLGLGGGSALLLRGTIPLGAVFAFILFGKWIGQWDVRRLVEHIEVATDSKAEWLVRGPAAR
jgi:hypothetical protein